MSAYGSRQRSLAGGASSFSSYAAPDVARAEARLSLVAGAPKAPVAVPLYSKYGGVCVGPDGLVMPVAGRTLSPSQVPDLTAALKKGGEGVVAALWSLHTLCDASIECAKDMLLEGALEPAMALLTLERSTGRAGAPHWPAALEARVGGPGNAPAALAASSTLLSGVFAALRGPVPAMPATPGPVAPGPESAAAAAADNASGAWLFRRAFNLMSFFNYSLPIALEALLQAEGESQQQGPPPAAAAAATKATAAKAALAAESEYPPAILPPCEPEVVVAAATIVLLFVRRGEPADLAAIAAVLPQLSGRLLEFMGYPDWAGVTVQGQGRGHCASDAAFAPSTPRAAAAAAAAAASVEGAPLGSPRGARPPALQRQLSNWAGRRTRRRFFLHAGFCLLCEQLAGSVPGGRAALAAAGAIPRLTAVLCPAPGAQALADVTRSAAAAALMELYVPGADADAALLAAGVPRALHGLLSIEHHWAQDPAIRGLSVLADSAALRGGIVSAATDTLASRGGSAAGSSARAAAAEVLALVAEQHPAAVAAAALPSLLALVAEDDDVIDDEDGGDRFEGDSDSEDEECDEPMSGPDLADGVLSQLCREPALRPRVLAVVAAKLKGTDRPPPPVPVLQQLPSTAGAALTRSLSTRGSPSELPPAPGPSPSPVDIDRRGRQIRAALTAHRLALAAGPAGLPELASPDFCDAAVKLLVDCTRSHDFACAAPVLDLLLALVKTRATRTALAEANALAAVSDFQSAAMGARAAAAPAAMTQAAGASRLSTAAQEALRNAVAANSVLAAFKAAGGGAALTAGPLGTGRRGSVTTGRRGSVTSGRRGSVSGGRRGSITATGRRPSVTGGADGRAGALPARTPSYLAKLLAASEVDGDYMNTLLGTASVITTFLASVRAGSLAPAAGATAPGERPRPAVAGLVRIATISDRAESTPGKSLSGLGGRTSSFRVQVPACVAAKTASPVASSDTGCSTPRSVMPHASPGHYHPCGSASGGSSSGDEGADNEVLAAINRTPEQWNGVLARARAASRSLASGDAGNGSLAGDSSSGRAAVDLVSIRAAIRMRRASMAVSEAP